MNEGHEPRGGDAPLRPLLDSSAVGTSADPDNPVNPRWDSVGGAPKGVDAPNATEGSNSPIVIACDGVTTTTKRPPSEWADSLRPVAPRCSGLDSHVLGMSTMRRTIVSAVFVALGVLMLLTGDLVRFGAYAAGFLLCALLIGGYSLRLVGDTLVARRFGIARRASLRDVNSVEPYSYRGCVSLRLWTRSGKRAPSIALVGRSVVNPAFRIDPTIAGHLLRYLNRPDVQWGPGAWQLLTSAAAGGYGTSSPESEGDARQLGTAAPKRPPTRLQRRTLRIGSGCALVFMVVFVLLAPVAWSGYNLSQRIQHGPEVTAKLLSQSVTSSTDRTGTSYTTHFRVTFYDVTRHAFITTQISANGYYSSQPAGSSIYIRYNPADPFQAELPGHPNHSFTTAVVMTIFALLILAASPWLVPRFWRRARRAPERAKGSPMEPNNRMSSIVQCDGTTASQLAAKP